jgi:hypothetical protein
VRSGFFFSSAIFVLSLPAWSQAAKPQSAAENLCDACGSLPTATKVPTGVILVKGAWSSASDSATAVPEGGNVTGHIFSNPYFGITYPLPPDWAEKYKGPPPSESGRYVLAQISPTDKFKGPARATILITAQDMFFTPLPAGDALELINYSKANLQAEYKVEKPPTTIKIAGHPFATFAYWSPVSELHWYDLALQIRCHTVEIVLTSRDKTLLQSLIRSMDKMQLPAEAGPTAGTGGDEVPVCVKDYASEKNLISRVDPVFTEHRFNAVAIRIIIDKQGKVKHIHFLSAFPDQAKAITDALGQWTFRQYLRDGKPAEVETGLMFGRGPYRVASPASNPAPK